MSHVPLIFIIAGEASGDQLGADLMASLRKQKEVRFAGIGGPAMTAQGFTSLFSMEELSIMGVMGILSQLPHLLRRLSYTVETIQKMHPDVVITIDAQEFSFQVMRRLHKLQTRPRLIHYVAPTVWAWRSGRARKLSKVIDRLLCLYPFEPPYFEKYGLKTTFVGHPVERGNVPEAQPEANLLCVLPGSRQSEINTLLPIFGETVKLLKKDIPDLKVVIPTLSSVKSLVHQGTQDWPLDVHIVVGDEARYAAFQKASVALAASGTVALQLASTGLPFVIAYKVSKINEWIGRALLKTPWVCMVNILLAFHTYGAGFVMNRNVQDKAKEPWIPEFLQDECKPESLKGELLKLLRNPEARSRQEQAMSQAMTLLRASPQTAAKIVLEETNNSLQAFRKESILLKTIIFSFFISIIIFNHSIFSMIKEEKQNKLVIRQKKAFTGGSPEILTVSFVKSIFEQGLPGYFSLRDISIENGFQVEKRRTFIAKCSDESYKLLDYCKDDEVIKGIWKEDYRTWYFIHNLPPLTEKDPKENIINTKEIIFYISDIRDEQIEQAKTNIFQDKVTFINGNNEKLTVSQIRKLFDQGGFSLQDTVQEKNNTVLKERKFELTTLNGSIHVLNTQNDNEIIKGIWMPDDDGWLFSWELNLDQGVIFTIKEMK